MTTLELLKRAKAAAPGLVQADTEQKNRALMAMAESLETETDAILAANALDLEAAREHISPVMLDRLALNAERIRGMADGIRQVAALPDPVGRVRKRVERPNGLIIEHVGVPMGVVAIIYESRPNVTSDAAALALKAGSACVLRGGKEERRDPRGGNGAYHRRGHSYGLPVRAFGGRSAFQRCCGRAAHYDSQSSRYFRRSADFE